MAKAIMAIDLVDEQDLVTGNAVTPTVDVRGREPMTPKQIVDAICQLDPDDANDTQTELYRRLWDKGPDSI